MSSIVLVVGTGDTKGTELTYVRDLITEQVDDGIDVVFVDVGTTPHSPVGDVQPVDVAAHHPDGADAVFVDDRGRALAAMSEALVGYVVALGDDVAGMVAAGGSGGTSLVAPAMQKLAIGVPKLIVSTVASADVSPYVGASDIAMMYSVADVAGLNRITRVVLANAAGAIAGMVNQRAVHGRMSETDTSPAVGLTMFGVTTPLVTQLTDMLADRFDPLVFHATGTGGASMEKLVEAGLLTAALDMTTTEIADLVVGGVFPAGPHRLDVFATTGTPWIGSVGAVDMVNFGARDTVPEKFGDRQLYVHNSNVTLMRTTPAENTAIGEFIAHKLNACEGPVRLLLPMGGVSMLDADGGPFWDPAADQALFSAIEKNLVTTDDRHLLKVDANINDPDFAALVIGQFDEVVASEVPAEDAR